MTEKLHTIFSSSGCPSGEDLQLYLQSKLPDEEAHRIEAHLADCEMCSDELEGLSLLKDPDRLPEIVENLEHRMAAKHVRILRLKPSLFLAAAAVIVLLIGTIFIFRFVVPLHQKPLLTEQQATTNISAEKEVPVLIEEEVSNETVEQHIPMDGKKKKSEARSEKIANEIEVNPAIIIEEPLPDIALEQVEVKTLDISGKGETEPQILQDKINGVQQTQLAETKETIEDSAPQLPPYFGGKNIRLGSGIGGVSSQQMGINFMTMAIEQFELQNFPEASKLFQEVISQEPENYKAMYHLALCYIDMDKQKKALRVLERLMEDPDSTYYKKAIDLTIKINANEPE